MSSADIIASEFAPAAGEIVDSVRARRENLAVMEQKAFSKAEEIARYLTELEKAYLTAHEHLLPHAADKNRNYKRAKYGQIYALVQATPDLIGDKEHNWTANVMLGIATYPCEELNDLFEYILKERPQAFTSTSLHIAASNPELQRYAHEILDARRDLADPDFAEDVLKWIVKSPKHHQDILAIRHGVLSDILDFVPDSITEPVFLSFIETMRRPFGQDPERLAECVKIATQDILRKCPRLKNTWLENRDPAWDKIAAVRGSDAALTNGGQGRPEALEET